MSPEQARGKAIDKRTDLWAYGCVLYEMLAGRAAFAGETAADTVSRILDRDPDWHDLPSDTPVAVTRLLRRCLVKQPAKRWRDIGDARIELDDLTTDASAPAVARPRDSESQMGPWVGVAAVAGALVAAALMLAVDDREAPVQLPAQFTLSFAGQTAEVVAATVPIPSPDGQHLAFVASDDEGGTSLWIRPLGAAAARRLQGTDGAQSPFWSPQGREIAFYADGRLKKVAVAGGPPQTIAPVPGVIDAAWGRAGHIVFRPGNRQPLFGISEAGGEVVQLTTLNAALTENSHRGPTFLPDGRRFLFTSRCALPENNALYVGSLDSPEVRRIMSLQSKAVYIPAGRGGPGALLYYRDGVLEARAFDPVSATVSGVAQSVLDDVEYMAAGIEARFEVSAQGRVIVAQPAGASEKQLTWYERTGEQTGTVGGPGIFNQPRLAPSGDRIAFNRPESQTGNRDVWLIDVTRGLAAPLTAHVSNDWHAVWSPDGKRVAFNSDRDGTSVGKVFLKQSLDVAGGEEPLLATAGAPSDWSRDGEWMVYVSEDDLYIVHASGERRPFPFLVRPSREGGARFSPDGRWLAYTSNETGSFEVFVAPFAGAAAAAAEARIQISEQGGEFPVWRADGEELYYMGRDSTIYAANTSALQATRSLPRPEPLFRACRGSMPEGRPVRGAWWSYPFDTLDGQRFLIGCAARPPGEFQVLLDWSLPPPD